MLVFAVATSLSLPRENRDRAVLYQTDDGYFFIRIETYPDTTCYDDVAGGFFLQYRDRRNRLSIMKEFSNHIRNDGKYLISILINGRYKVKEEILTDGPVFEAVVEENILTIKISGELVKHNGSLPVAIMFFGNRNRYWL